MSIRFEILGRQCRELAKEDVVSTRRSRQIAVSLTDYARPPLSANPRDQSVGTGGGSFSPAEQGSDDLVGR